MCGEAVGTEQPILNGDALRVGDRPGFDVSDDVAQLGGVVSKFPGTFGPALAQLAGTGVGLLGAPGVERGDHRRFRRVLVADRHALFDLGPAGGERLEDIGRDLREVVDAIVDRSPLDAEGDGQVVAQLRLVQVADRLRRGLDPTCVERRPLAVLTAHHVGDEDVRVEVRVAVARGAMPERRSDKAVAAHEVDAAVPAARPHDVAFGPAVGGFDSGVVRVTDQSSHVRIA